METGFGKELDDVGLWAVVFDGTIEVVYVDGQPLVGLDPEQVDDAIELLKSGSLKPDRVPDFILPRYPARNR